MITAIRTYRGIHKMEHKMHLIELAFSRFLCGGRKYGKSRLATQDCILIVRTYI